ncbi:MAG: hypothetical protein GY832_30920 [Chloroflexi bacterium]|nr:hypothetical protein [Chloroflexota bacterium]
MKRNWEHEKPRTRREEAIADMRNEPREYILDEPMTPAEIAERDSREWDALSQRMTYLLHRRVGYSLFKSERKIAQTEETWQEYVDELDRIDDEILDRGANRFDLRAIRQD